MEIAKIGDKIVKDSFGQKVEYEVTGYDGGGHPVVRCIGLVADDVVNEEVIKEMKETVVKKTATAPKKAVAKKK